jgi:hypothetical protein
MLWSRWLWLRALGLIFGSAFYALWFQIRGLVGAQGILPAGSYLTTLANAVPGIAHLWAAPSVLWLGSSDGALLLVVGIGLLASVTLTTNLWPRLSATVCTAAFLSCIAVLQDFSAYQSDGMLLQAGLASVFLAPRGLRPRLGADSPPPRGALWLLRWEWFSIYFESGVVKMMSGDPQWHALTAMDHYYENNPLPTWIGWYVQQLPHAFHAATALLVLIAELAGPWAIFGPRRLKLAVVAGLSVLQIGIIATANYAFLNYLVLSLGVLCVDDRAWTEVGVRYSQIASRYSVLRRRFGPQPRPRERSPGESVARPRRPVDWASAVMFVWTLYACVLAFMPLPLPTPMTVAARVLDPFRVANAYGLFAVMTTEQDEIEFQGQRPDSTWIAYPFRYKPQDPRTPPGIYAPYQPRFDWNLWFAALGSWTQNPWVVTAEQRLLINDPSVLSLFAENPFATHPPVAVRTVRWRYWFTDWSTRRQTGRWWNRELAGEYAPPVKAIGSE